MSRHHLVLALFALLLPLVKAFADSEVIVVGGWRPIENIGDPHVKEIAEFAVSEYNQSQKKNLVFQSVVRGETQVVAGIKYRLVISVKEDDSFENYEAVVWEKRWMKFRKLISFDDVNN
ncbi:cysteine proteinase inhibitor 5-like [Rosa rugosa]|uniref:cysteine proteinase inhibitor 5-like n=1 Tax=Rosa rugosa TaxID=74645 RepID=UPI002B413472|nr:cysteine proteinase inhibitor 5-like [Rosa rugosa]